MKKQDFLYLPLLLFMGSILFYFASFTGLTYDGGLYASLGLSLFSGKGYVFNGLPGDVPPLLPLLLCLGFLLFGSEGYRYVVPFFSLIGLISFYLVLRDKMDEKAILLCVLIFFFNPVFLEVATNVATDSLILTFVFSALLVAEKFKVSFKKYFLMGLLFGFAFLTKYSALLLFAPVFFLVLRDNDKKILVSLLVSTSFISPWIWWCLENWGVPLKSHSTYLLNYLFMNFPRFYRVIIPLLIKYSPETVFILGSIFFSLETKRSWRRVLRNEWFQFLILPLLAVAVWKDKEIRYLLLSFAALTVGACKLVDIFRLKKKIYLFLILLLVASLFFQANQGLKITYGCALDYKLLEDAGLWLKKNVPGNVSVLTQSYRQMHFFSGKITYQFPRDKNRVFRYIKEKNISYIVVDTYEKTTPSYAYSLFKNFKVAASFQDKHGKVIIYCLNP